MNCCVLPSTICGFAGVTASEVNTAGVTVSTVSPDTPLPAWVAVIVAVPVATLVARP